MRIQGTKSVLAVILAVLVVALALVFIGAGMQPRSDKPSALPALTDPAGRPSEHSGGAVSVVLHEGAGGSDEPSQGLDLVFHEKPEIRLRMVLIPAGDFIMGDHGTDIEPYVDAVPVHKVTISRPFYMGVHEVTQAQWEAVMGTSPSTFGGNPQNPVETVSWDECQQFVTRLNRMGVGIFRLPTEAEWEYACRAGTHSAYFWGDSFREGTCNAENDDNGKDNKQCAYFRSKGLPVGSTMAVGAFAPNDWGLYDMHGNVYEWCSDLYGKYQSDEQTDPVGASHGDGRIARGGSWGSSRWVCRSAFRYRSSRVSRFHFLGFRLVRQLQAGAGARSK